MNEHDLDLLHREADGLTTDAESERLRSRLESDHELRVVHDELQAVKVAFAAFQEKEPPPGLKDAIMRALPEQPPEVASAAPRSWWAALTDRILTPRPVKLAYAFALGVVVAFAVSTILIPTGNIDAGDVVGAMGDFQGMEKIELTAYPIMGDGVTGTIIVGRSAETVVVKFVWESDHLVEASIRYNESEMSIVRTESPGLPQVFRTSMARGSFDFEGSGSIEEIVSFERFVVGGSDFDISVTSNGEVVFDYITASTEKLLDGDATLVN